MKTSLLAKPAWSTSSFGQTADTSPGELFVLGKHLDLCKRLSGRLFRLQCIAEALHRFVAPRFVTTLVAAAFVIGFGSLVS